MGSLIGVFLLFLIGMKVLLTPEDLSFAAGLTFAVALCWMYFPLDCLRQSLSSPDNVVCDEGWQAEEV